jgi:peptidyl-dipeptidase A
MGMPRKPGSPFVRCILILLLLGCASRASEKPSVSDAQAFMDKTEAEMLELINDTQRVAWVQQTYITSDTDLLSAKANERLIAHLTELVNASKRFDALNLPPDLGRKFKLLKLGLSLPAPSDAKLRSELTSIATSLDSSYGSGKYCPETDPSTCLGIDELEARMAKSRDPKELEAMWVGWHAYARPVRAFCRVVQSGCARTGLCRYRSYVEI